jgi:hypothetical protein
MRDRAAALAHPRGRSLSLRLGSIRHGIAPIHIGQETLDLPGTRAVHFRELLLEADFEPREYPRPERHGAQQ